ncbi:MAG TPA: NifU N-terminal domain-containing protein [Bdellovibrionota bacterium]|nr:NifU N-terminal domain-containing protein [Bdellovibrionota bacterium]
MTTGLQVQCDPTPNPNAMKFTLNRKVIEHGSRTFHAGEGAEDPLAQKLLAIPGVKSLFFLNNFISISRDQTVPWEKISPKVEEVLRSHFG